MYSHDTIFLLCCQEIILRDTVKQYYVASPTKQKYFPKIRGGYHGSFDPCSPFVVFALLLPATPIAHYKYVYNESGNIVRSIDITAKKEYNYEYEEGRIVRATEAISKTLKEDKKAFEKTLDLLSCTSDSDIKPARNM